MKRWLIGAGVILALAVLAVLVQRTVVDAPVPTQQAGGSGLSATARPMAALPPTVPPAPPAVVAVDPPLPPMPESNVDAATSMAEARQFGDPRTPPIMRSDNAEKPTPDELANPELYQKYEERQHKRLIGAYLKATGEEIPRLQADIEKARAMGLSEEQLREGIEKQQRMQQMRDQLMAEHPDLAR